MLTLSMQASPAASLSRGVSTFGLLALLTGGIVGKLHTHGLDEAQSDLGLTLPVRVMFQRIPASPGSFVSGKYTGIDVFHNWHNILIHRNQTVAAASAALWHELQHALQCERAGGWPRFWSEYQRQWKEAGVSCSYSDDYRRIPYEAEAWNMTALARDGALAKLVCEAEDCDDLTVLSHSCKVEA